MSPPAGVEKPPSPPHSNDGDYGLHAVQQHLAGLDSYAIPRSIRPATYTEGVFEFGNYGDPRAYQQGPSSSYYPPQPTFHRVVHPATPPTLDDGIRTRSGKALASPVTPGKVLISRQSHSPKPKRAPKMAKAKKSNAPIIDQPLSILTADYALPLKNMEEWVYRSAEVRQEEAAKKGHIARPMNSFMLYRSAYAGRVKQFCKENNHQVVSQVSGASWPLEPKEIREMYEGFARTERENHQHAHPNYKFAPVKNGGATKKRKDREEDSDIDDEEWEIHGAGGSKRSRTNTGELSRSESSTPFETRTVARHPLAHYLHPSSYQAINPNGPPPVEVGPESLQGYYETTVTRYRDQVEDVSLKKIHEHFPHQAESTALIGLPNGNHQDLLKPQASGGGATAGPVQSERLDPLDPRLFQYDPTVQYGKYEVAVDDGYGVPSNHDYGPSSYPASHQYGYPSQQTHPGMVMLTDGENTWYQSREAGADFDAEFGKYPV